MTKFTFLNLLLTCFFFVGCDADQQPEEVRPSASFFWEIDEENHLQVNFFNNSIHADHFFWEFGDGQTSELEAPIHSYAEPGVFEVVLTAFDSNGNTDTYQRDIDIVSIPTPPSSPLTGDDFRVWKLIREGSAGMLGPDPENPDIWWTGLINDGSRPCMLKHEFIFSTDGTFEFRDHNGFYGDETIWAEEDPQYGICFEPSASNMTVSGQDVHQWSSGVYEFSLTENNVTLIGEGAWIGFPFLGTHEHRGIDMQDSVSLMININEFEGYNLMDVIFDHDNGYWTFHYASYDEPGLEPELVE